MTNVRPVANIFLLNFDGVVLVVAVVTGGTTKSTSP